MNNQNEDCRKDNRIAELENRLRRSDDLDIRDTYNFSMGGFVVIMLWIAGCTAKASVIGFVVGMTIMLVFALINRATGTKTGKGCTRDQRNAELERCRRDAEGIRDLANEVRDLAREASQRDLEARREAEALLDCLKNRIAELEHKGEGK